MVDMLKSRLLKLWFLVLVFCAVWAELGRLTGRIQRPILDDFFFGADTWWGLPPLVHIGVLLVLVGLLFLIARQALFGVGFPTARGRRVLAGVIVLLGVFLCLNQFSELENVVSRATDFGTIHSGSTALFADGDPYAATENGYFYPPLLAFLFGPLLLLPPVGASTLFFSLKFMMVVWTLLACDRLVRGTRFGAGRRDLFITGLIFVAARFWTADLQFGNTNVLILFLMTAAIVLDRQDRAVAAGLVLALTVSIKVIPAVLCLHFLVTRRWRVLGFFLAGLVGFNLLPWLFLQGTWWESWTAYFDAGVTGKLGQRLAQPDNQSLWGLINRTLPDVPLETLRWVWMGLSAALAAFAGYVSLRARANDTLAQVAAVSLYPLLGLLVSPGSWVVHYTAVLLPMAVVLTVAMSGTGPGPGRWSWVLFFCANFAFTMSGWSRATVNASISQSWFVAAAVMLMIGIGTWILVRGDLEPAEN